MRFRNIGRKTQLDGLSLSLCISDILDGRVQEGQVCRIFAATRASSEEDFRKVLEGYAKDYWQRDPERGMAIAMDFYQAGKITQPRLEGKGCHDVGRGHWRMGGQTSQFGIAPPA